MSPNGSRAAIAAWIYERFGEYALARDVELFESIQVPLVVLLRHLQREYEQGARSLGWYLSPTGVARLHELESSWRHTERENRRTTDGAGWLRDLLGRYSSAT